MIVEELRRIILNRWCAEFIAIERLLQVKVLLKGNPAKRRNAGVRECGNDILIIADKTPSIVDDYMVT